MTSLPASEILGLDQNDTSTTNELVTGFGLNGAVIELTDDGGTYSADLMPLLDVIDTDDDDADPTNELISSAGLNGSTLEIVEGGIIKFVDLSGLNVDDNDADDTNELITDLQLSGTTLLITEAGDTINVALGNLVNDADFSTSNELITGVALSGTTLQITEAGDTTSVNLSSLINDADFETDNEVITNVALSGTTLQITEAGDTIEVELASLVNDADADVTNELQDISFSGNTLSITGGEGIGTHDDVTLDNFTALTAGSFTASESGFSGDGSGLTNVPISAINGISTTSLVNSANSAGLSSGVVEDAPILLGSIDNAAAFNQPEAVFVSDGLALFTSPASSQLTVVDVSVPSNPSIRSTVVSTVDK